MTPLRVTTILLAMVNGIPDSIWEKGVKCEHRHGGDVPSQASDVHEALGRPP